MDVEGKVEVAEDIIQILKYASLAPNSHNSQPWKIKILSDLEFIVQSDPTRWLPRVDPENRELLLSIGAFWENLEQAALALGFESHAEVLANSPKDIEILKIKLVKCASRGDDRLELIKKKATDRRPYEKKELQGLHLKELEKLLPDRLVYFPRKSKEGEWIASNLVEANKRQTFDDEKQKELAEWLRFSRSEVAEKRDGLTPEMLGMTGLVKFFWYAFMSRKNAFSGSFRNKGIENVRNQVNNCSGFIIITSEDLSVHSTLEAGRNFEKLALKCTELGVSIHPMSQLMEESPWKEELESSLGLSKPVQLVLRAGYSRKRSERSVRRPVEEIII